METNENQEINNVRNILLRALFDPDFHNLLVTEPEHALKDYQLSDEERNILLQPSADIYRFVNPGRSLPGSFNAPAPTTIIIVIIVAIIITTVITPSRNSVVSEFEKFNPLIKAIQTSSGAERYDLVRTLINEITKGY